MPAFPSPIDPKAVEAACAAAKSNDVPTLDDLLTRNSGAIDARDQSHERRAPLHYAASRGHVEAVAMLLACDANANIRSGALVKDGDSTDDWYWEPGWTPLILAVRGGHVEVVRRLLDAGADPGRCDHVGFSALHAAAVGGSEEIVSALVARRVSLSEYSHARHFDEELGWAFVGTPLHAAAACGNEVATAALIAAGAPLEECWFDKRTPIFYAAAYGHAGTIRLLARGGANVNAAEDRLECSGRITMTPLHYAASNGHVEAVRTLLHSGADPSARDLYSKQTPGEMASDNDHAEIAEIIHEHRG